MKNVDPKTFDLSLKNPNKNTEQELREPKEILEEMKKLDENNNEILKEINKLIWSVMKK